MKAIVVGCGLIGSDYGDQSHAGTYMASDRIELVEGIDLDPQRRRQFEARWDVASNDVIGGPIDVASICTPPSARFLIISQLLKSGVKAIWCEKPLAETVAEAEGIVAICKDAGVPLQVNFQRRFDPLHQRAKTYDLGKPLHFQCTFSGDMLRVGCHAIDLYRWFGADSMQLDPIESNGTTVFDVNLTGPKGRVSFAAMGQQLLYGPTEDSLAFPGVEEQRLYLISTQGLHEAMRRGLDSLLDHLEKGTPLLCTGEDGLAALRIHEAIC